MRLDKVNNIIQVAQNLKDTIHHVLICKNTESVIGYIQFTGIRCEKLIKTEGKKKEIIEFIGDSITCGNGSDTTEISCADGKWYDQHNAYMSYGPLISREFEMDWILSSVSGIGLTHSCCGTKYTMPDIYNRINFRPKGKKWRSKGNSPKLICITLGQNDGLQEAERYISTYVKFVKKIKRLHPQATIVCCSSPMGEEKLQAYQAEHLPTVVQRLNNSGIQKVDFFCYEGKYRGGCLLHPTLAEHLEIAAELKAFLKDKI